MQPITEFLTGSRGAGSGTLGVMGSAALVVSALLAAPILVVIANGFSGGQGVWPHLASTVLSDYITTTFFLAAGVGVGVVLLGVTCAWLITAYRFPGSRVLEWALILPLAAPAYVVAYAYSDFLQFQGPLQSSLRALMGWGPGDYRFPDVRSLGGAIIVFAVVLYPYVYLLARAAFLDQSKNLLNAGRLLGLGPRGVFFKVALPMARPAVVAGTALALMETLADFGAVSYFGVQTFTTGIFRAWQSMNDLVAASQLSCVLLLAVLALLAVERWNRGGARQYDTAVRGGGRRTRLAGARAWCATVWCLLPPVLGFLLPVAVLCSLSWSEPGRLFTGRYLGLAWNSFTLAVIAAMAAVILAVLLAYAARLCASTMVRWAKDLAGLGYALPGAVIAVGILVPVARIDNLLADWAEAAFGIKLGLLFTGGVLALVYAYLARFLAVAIQAVEAGLTKVRPSMEDAARGLGASPWQVLQRVHAPMLAPSLLTAGLIVFVEVMKELPATFVLRPFNFDTLAVQAYHYASDERLPQAAAASLLIVAVGLLPVILLSRAMLRGRRR